MGRRFFLRRAFRMATLPAMVSRRRPYTFAPHRWVRMPEDAVLRLCWVLRDGLLDETSLTEALGDGAHRWMHRALRRAISGGLVRPCGPPMIPGVRYFSLTRKGELEIRMWAGLPRERQAFTSKPPETTLE